MAGGRLGWREECFEGGVTGERSAWRESWLEGGVPGRRSAWREECLEKGMTGGRLGWREKSLKQDDEGLNAVRQSALLLLCQMNPDQALAVRGRCVEACRMPGLAVLLTLQHAALALDQEDLITFLSGLLLGTNTDHRSWISFFVRNGQKRRCPALAALRTELAARVARLLGEEGEEEVLGAAAVREAAALLRLFTALRGVVGMKFTEEEVGLLVALITRPPTPSSPASPRLVSLGLAMHRDASRC